MPLLPDSSGGSCEGSNPCWDVLMVCVVSKMYFNNFFKMPLLCVGILSAMKKDAILFLVLQGCFATLVGCVPMGIKDQL